MRGPWIAVALFCTLVPLAGQFYGDRAGGWLGIDFRAYYCASLAQREGNDPYFASSIARCESETPAPFYRSPKNVTVPAPYPPYALALFYPLTYLPFGAAAAVWWTILLGCVAAAAYALARIAKQPILVGWSVVVLSLGLTSLSSGNVLPLGVAAVIVAGLFVARGELVPAVGAVVVAMVEPHIALPAALALFVRYRATRLPLALALVALAAISVAIAGPDRALAYVTDVLPAHALSEVSRDNQYSFSTVLAAFGVPDASAVLAGSFSYALACVAGIVLGLRLAGRYDEPALTLLVPPAISLLGGSFVHTGEIAMAIPACLLLYMRARAYRPWLFGSLLLLAVPWMLSTSIALFLAPLFPVAYLTYELWRRERKAALAAALASAAIIAGLFVLSASSGGAPLPHAHAHPPIDPRLAEASWRELVLGNTTNRPIMWLLRAPTWAGLIGFAVTAVALARQATLPLPVRDRLLESRA